ncbi:NTP transferase domain-containing protein [Peribacillus kribbensis]|uniref:NTP transferase domain-containing protein n=1 Tax=Peribacillus kribbensis TaxID=356658 RepID=UPI00041915CB|nr:NTP transferase domain-containing protein [Peribacillus kribbensis]
MTGLLVQPGIHIILLKINRMIRIIHIEGAGNDMGTIMGIYLAAGKSERMGTNKLALPLEGIPLGNIAMHTALASSLDHLAVVVNKKDPLDWMDPLLQKPEFKKHWTLVRCEKDEAGQAYSIKMGIQQAIKIHADAAVILLADQPFVPRFMIENLITHFRTQPCLFTASGYKRKPRPPILFSKEAFHDLLHLEEDQGARHLIRGKWSSRGHVVQYLCECYFLDIDHKEDYEKAKELKKWT